MPSAHFGLAVGQLHRIITLIPIPRCQSSHELELRLLEWQGHRECGKGGYCLHLWGSQYTVHISHAKAGSQGQGLLSRRPWCVSLCVSHREWKWTYWWVVILSTTNTNDPDKTFELIKSISFPSPTYLRKKKKKTFIIHSTNIYCALKRTKCRWCGHNQRTHHTLGMTDKTSYNLNQTMFW